MKVRVTLAQAVPAIFKMIDIHTHLHPPKLFAAIRRWFAEHSSWVLTHPTEPQAVAESLRRHGVDRFVFCSYAHKSGIARSINKFLTDTSNDLERFGLPLATVHLDDVDFVEDYRIALRDGCIGLKIHEDVQKLLVDDPRFDPVFQLTAESNGFILVHVGPIPWTDGTNRGPERLATVLRKHPGLKIVVAHLGSPSTIEFLSLTRDFANLYLDTTMALAESSPFRTELDDSVFEESSDRILFGSDHPNLPYDYSEEFIAIQKLSMSEDKKQKILRGNASELLRPHLQQL